MYLLNFAKEKNYNKKMIHIYKKSKIKATLGLEKERLDGKAKSSRWRGWLEYERSYILGKLFSMFWGPLHYSKSIGRQYSNP